MRVTYAGVVDTEPRNSDVTLAVVEAFGADWVRGEHEVDDDAPDNRDRASKEVHILPGGKCTCDLTKAVVDDGGEDRHVACAGVPHAHAEGLLVLLIPPAHDEHEHRTDACFEEAEEETLGVERPVVIAHCGEHEAYPPDRDNEGRDALNGETLGEVNGWVGSHDETKVEDRRRHGIAVADQ